MTEYRGFAKLKLFLALSRTPHGILDLCTPLLVALLWLGTLPAPNRIILGTLAAFAGYTAVYALNDIVDLPGDREKLRRGEAAKEQGYLDAVFVRHPLAHGYLSLSEALLWTGGWSVVSLVAAWLLNPVCALILIAGCVLESIYCLLLRVSALRTLISGIVKTLGGLAAIFAVDATPETGLLLVVFFWLFFWEIGGQNVPADWHDIEEDNALRARTVPVVLGPRSASFIVLMTLAISVVLSGILFQLVPRPLPIPAYGAALLVGGYLLLLPALRLIATRKRTVASTLFNRASWYPCLLLVIVLASYFWNRMVTG